MDMSTWTGPPGQVHMDRSTWTGLGFEPPPAKLRTCHQLKSSYDLLSELKLHVLKKKKKDISTGAVLLQCLVTYIACIDAIS